MTGPTQKDEERIRAVLDGLAESVPVSSDAYRGVQAKWRRRERRRRHLALVLAAVVIGLTVIVGLWALNRADPRDGVILNTGAAHVQVLDHGFGPEGAAGLPDTSSPDSCQPNPGRAHL